MPPACRGRNLHGRGCQHAFHLVRAAYLSLSGPFRSPPGPVPELLETISGTRPQDSYYHSLLVPVSYPPGKARGNQEKGDLLRNVLTVTSPKGGVGKTSLVANVAANIGWWGNRVLAVDLDARGDLGFDLGYHGDPERDDAGRGLCDALLKDAPLEPRPSKAHNVDVVGGGHHLDFAVSVGDRLTADAHMLTRALATVASDYELIIIDCPASGGPLPRLGLAAATGAVIPTRADYASINAINKIARHWREITETYNPDLELLGVVLTQVPPEEDARQREIRDNLSPLSVFDTCITNAPDAAYEARNRGLAAHRLADILEDRCNKARHVPTSTRRLAEDSRRLATDYRDLTNELATMLGGTFTKTLTRIAAQDRVIRSMEGY